MHTIETRRGKSFDNEETVLKYVLSRHRVKLDYIDVPPAVKTLPSKLKSMSLRARKKAIQGSTSLKRQFDKKHQAHDHEADEHDYKNSRTVTAVREGIIQTAGGAGMFDAQKTVEQPALSAARAFSGQPC